MWEFYGGDLAGVIEKLDYLQELGVEVIYFNPIYLFRRRITNMIFGTLTMWILIWAKSCVMKERTSSEGQSEQSGCLEVYPARYGSGEPSGVGRAVLPLTRKRTDAG